MLKPGPSTYRVIDDILIPHVPPGGITADPAFLGVGIVGHTIAPWQLFFQQRCAADKRLSFKALKWARLDTFLGGVIESQTIDDSQEPDSYLDPLLLQAPSLALNQAAREELRLMDEIKLMLRAVWMMIWGKNIRLVSKVEEHQKRLERTQEALKDYLSQVSDENLSEEDIDWKFIVLDYSQELTAIGTLIRRDLGHADSPDSVESGTITGGQRGTGSFLCSNP